jgi:hypothetical protein
LRLSTWQRVGEWRPSGSDDPGQETVSGVGPVTVSAELAATGGQFVSAYRMRRILLRVNVPVLSSKPMST